MFDSASEEDLSISLEEKKKYEANTIVRHRYLFIHDELSKMLSYAKQKADFLLILTAVCVCVDKKKLSGAGNDVNLKLIERIFAE